MRPASGDKPVWAKSWGYVLAVTRSDAVLAQHLLLPQAQSWKLGCCCEIMHISPLRFFLFLTQEKKKGLSKEVLCTLLHSLLTYAPVNPIMELSSGQRSILVLLRGCTRCSLAEFQQVILTSTKLGCPHQLLHVIWTEKAKYCRTGWDGLNTTAKKLRLWRRVVTNLLFDPLMR